MSNLIKNPFIKGSYYYDPYKNYYNYKTKILNCKYEKYSEYPEYSTSPNYLVNNFLPKTMKDYNTIPFSELTVLDMSRNISTEIDYSNTFDITDYTETSEPTEYTGYTGTETFIDDPQFLQISSFEPIYKHITEPETITETITEPITEPIPRSTSRYIFREITKPIYKPIYKSTVNITHLSNPIKSINKIKRPTGRRSNMPLYDDEYHKSLRDSAAYKKQLMYKSLRFASLLTLYGNLPQHKFYFKFENWLVANNINDLETTKKYDSEYKLYRNIIYENV
jgi:hypothetical protein